MFWIFSMELRAASHRATVPVAAVLIVTNFSIPNFGTGCLVSKRPDVVVRQRK